MSASVAAVSLTAAGIAASGVIAHAAACKLNLGGYAGPLRSWLFGWLWFNVFIAAYEAYVVANRRSLRPAACDGPSFWASSGKGASSGVLSSGRFWLDAWGEYACRSDARYFQADQFVHWVEFGNVVLVVLLWAAFALGSRRALVALLLVQGYHCVVYFVSWIHHHHVADPGAARRWYRGRSLEQLAYLALSAVWVAVPFALALALSVKK